MTARQVFVCHDRRRSTRWSLFVMAALLGWPTVVRSSEAASGEDQAVQILERASQAFTQVAKKSMPGVVFIKVEKTVELSGRAGMPSNDPFDFFGDDFFRRFFGDPRGVRPGQPPQSQRQIGQGSGFVISRDGYILTNNHVVGGADKITVRLHDGREFEAEHIGADPQSEVAVIKIAVEGDLPVIPLGDSDALEIGEWVIAIGNPFGLSETLTVGVVSAKGRSGIGLADYEDFIQTDAAINPGNSGGPLLNIKGEAIGINTAIFTRSGGYMGIGFAVPINMARAIKEQLVETGKVVRGHLGIMIQEVTRELADSFGLSMARGILISDVLPDSPADRHGLKQGDILLKIDGQEILTVAAFRNRIALTSPGTSVPLTVFRDGDEIEVAIVIGSQEDSGLATSNAIEKWKETLGFSVEELSAEIAQRFGYEPGSGVLVTEVRPQSPAARGGIRPGHLIVSVNRRKVATPDEFYGLLSLSEKTVLLQVRDGRHSRFVAIRL